MYRIDNTTSIGVLPPPSPSTSTPDRFFSDGDYATGLDATIVDAEWLNMQQEEICNVVTAAGFPLNKGDRTQLYQAIRQMIAEGSVLPPDLSLYVMKTGDTMTGALGVNDNIASAATVSANFVYSAGSISAAANINATGDIGATNVYASANIGALGTVTGSRLVSEGNIDAVDDLTCGSNVHAAGVFATNGVFANTWPTQDFGFAQSGGYRNFAFGGTLWNLSWEVATGTLTWFGTGAPNFSSTAGSRHFTVWGNYFYQGSIPVPVSDAPRRGLEHVLQLVGTMQLRPEDVRDVLPEAVQIFTTRRDESVPAVESLAMTDGPIILALVHAVQELNGLLMAQQGARA
jgi:hypothetical protein